jgi:Tfp pilus assembly protein PilN
MKVDINLLPEEHRPNKLALPLTVLFIVLILAAGYFGYDYYNRSVAANDQLAELQARLDSIDTETQQVIAESQIADYQEQIVQTEAEIDLLQTMEADYELHNAEKIYWKPILQTIRELAPTDVILTAFEQDDNGITLKGELSQDVDSTILIVEYATQLKTRGFCSRVLFDTETDMPSDFQVDKYGEPAKVIGFVMRLLEVEAGGEQQ